MSEIGKVYVCSGTHPEFCSAEACSADETLRLLTMGREVLAGAAEDVGLELFSANTDYHGSSLPTGRRSGTIDSGSSDSGSSSWWGCHENLAVRQPPQVILPRLAGHLCSRVIYTGAGGFFNYFQSPSITFSLSPRESVIRGLFESGRGIDCFSRARETLGLNQGRVHLICGENNLSRMTNSLKIGTTAALVHLLDEGFKPDPGFEPSNPVRAFRVFCHDPACAARVATRSGNRTAIEIQRHYENFVRDNLRSLPEWGSRLVSAWDKILDRIETGGAAAVDRVLDWATKYSIFGSILRSNGLDWRQFRVLNSVVFRLATCPGCQGSSELDLDHRKVDSQVRSACERRLEAVGLAWDAVERFMPIRWQLLKADLEYGYLHPKGTHLAMADAGLMNDAPPAQMDGHKEIAIPRVERRNSAIRRLAGTSGAWANWTRVGKPNGLILDLLDPFSKKAVWKKPHDTLIEANPLETLRQRSQDLLRAGRYETAGRQIQRVLGCRPVWSANRGLAREAAWIEARRGRPAAAVAILDAAYRRGATARSSIVAITDYMNVMVFSSLSAPSVVMRSCIEAGFSIPESRWLCEPLFHPIFFEYAAAFFLHHGQLGRAEELLRKARRIEKRCENEPRVQARILIALAECARRSGRLRLASLRLRRAQRLQQRAQCIGDYANLSLPMALKLAPDKATALEIVNEASTLQRRESFLGRARILVLAARVCGDRRLASRWRRAVLAYRKTVPAIAECRILARILNSWNSWVGGGTPEGQDRFWGL